MLTAAEPSLCLKLSGIHGPAVLVFSRNDEIFQIIQNPGLFRVNVTWGRL